MYRSIFTTVGMLVLGGKIWSDTLVVEVFDRASGVFVSGANVVYRDSARNVVDTLIEGDLGVPDSEGVCSLHCYYSPNMKSGWGYVEVTKEGYVPVSRYVYTDDTRNYVFVTIYLTPQCKTVKIVGKVEDETTGDSIENVLVEVLPKEIGCADYKMTYTTEAGRYELEFCVWCSTRVKVRASHPRFKVEVWREKENLEDGDWLLVTSGITISGINFTLTPQDTSYDTTGICGRVYDKVTGVPLEGVVVNVYSCDTLDDSLIIQWRDSVFTDSTGRYCFELEEGGCFYIEVDPYPLNYFVPPLKRVYVPEGTILTVDFPLTPREGNLRLWVTVASECYCELNSPVEVALYDSEWSLKMKQTVGDIDTVVRVCFDPINYNDTVYVSASSPGFFTEFYENARELVSATPIVMTRDRYVWIGLTHIYDSIGVVIGRVTEEESGNPIYLARVCIPSLRKCVHTGVEGFFSFSHVPTGEYIVCASHPNHGEVCSDSFEVKNDTVVVDIVLPSDTLRPGKITGRVVDPDGDCVKAVGVYVYPVGVPDPIASVGVQFDSVGNCVYEAVVPPGKYQVLAIAFLFDGEWYNDKQERENADTVTVERGEVVSGIDFVLEPVGTGNITGKITDPDGNPIPNALVWAKSLLRLMPVYKETVTDTSGVYVLKVPAGVYTVGANARGFLPNVYEEDVPINKDGITVEGIDIILTPLPQTPHKITGRVVDDSTGEGIFPAFVIAISPDFCGYSITDTSGNYAIENVPQAEDWYIVFACAPFYLPEFYDNAISLADATLVDSNQSGVDFGLIPVRRVGIRAITGRVKAKDGTPIEGAVVYVVEGTTRNEVVVGGGQTDVNGNYFITNLPDGVYTVRISRPGYKETTCPSVDLVGKSAEVNVTLNEAGVEEVKVEIKEIEFNCTPSVSYGVVDVSFALPRTMKVKVALYDVTGREISVIVNRKVEKGRHSFSLNTTYLSQGVYFLKLITPTEKRVRKLLLLR